MTLNTKAIPASVYDADLPLPNVYFVTVTHLSGQHTLYVAADTSGSAVQKVRRHFREHHSLALYRSTSEIRLRRFRVGDYLEHPQGLQDAREVAALANERDTVAKLDRRHQEVAALCAEVATANEVGADMDWAALEAQLGDELRRVG